MLSKNYKNFGSADNQFVSMVQFGLLTSENYWFICQIVDNSTDFAEVGMLVRYGSAAVEWLTPTSGKIQVQWFNRNNSAVDCSVFAEMRYVGVT